MVFLFAVIEKKLHCVFTFVFLVKYSAFESAGIISLKPKALKHRIETPFGPWPLKLFPDLGLLLVSAAALFLLPRLSQTKV